MEPLIALVAGFVLARLTGAAGVDPLDGWEPSLRTGLALMFLMTAVSHVHPRTRGEIVGMVPPRLPRPELLVKLTALLELAGAVGLLFPATAPWAAAGLILLLVALFPANVSAARRHVAQGDPIGPRAALQAVFVAALALTLA